MLRQEGQLAAEAAKGEHVALQVNGAGMAPADSKALLVQGSALRDVLRRSPRVLCQKGQSIVEAARCEQIALQVNGAGRAPADSNEQMWSLACSNQSLF